MAERMWTESQKDAIEARRGTVLVAAAAGSGKTAVLVQRALEYLTDRERPVDADRLLIVTFTKAAAAEMRARLERELYVLLRKDPGNAVLRRQGLLLSQAHIGTVDSFCAEMLREHFHMLDLAPDFRIVSDKQQDDLVTEALSEALRDAFDRGSVMELANAFAGERDDRKLSEMVLTLYRFMQSHPFPEKWLDEKVGLYLQGDPTPWERVILEYARETAEHCERLCGTALSEAEEDIKTGGKVGAAFFQAFTADREKCCALLRLTERGDWNGAGALVREFSLYGKGRLKESEKDGLYDRLEGARQEIKRAMEDLRKVLYGDREQCTRELRATAPLLKSLEELTMDFSRRYDEKKRERDLLDYSDLEHLCIKLFLTPEGERTQTATEAGARFDEIMIDEYQDINEVQNSLFWAVSREGKNLFMVGDVKQSIYSFRRAMPEIFLRCREAFPKYDREKDSYPASLTLDRNFRSRREVVDTVNFVFSRLMSRAAGDIDYRGEERLVCGAQYPQRPGFETELAFISRPVGVPAEDVEAAFLARRIKELVNSGFSIVDRGEERPVRYGDFCVLLRSANKYAHAYAQGLSDLGVPARATVTGGFFAAAEIGVMLSLLRVIDNPNQDIPLLSVLMSPLYGFSPDDAARLRADAGKASVYVSLTEAAQFDPRCAGILRELSEFRSLSATMPSDAFLTYLYERTGYEDMALAMESGENRVQNLRQLLSYAKEYESTGFHGISGFVRFLDRLRQNNTDLQAGAAPASENAVSVMSIHKSKGLEFPVCIVAGCGRNFASDQQADVLLHPELGLGVKLRDRRRGARFTTTAREAIALETARSSAAEELRVLYVAMTRAKEKLILVGSGNHLDRALRKLSLELSEKGPAPYTVRRGKSALDWLMLCALCHPDGGELRTLCGASDTLVCRDDYTPWRISLTEYQPPEEETPAEREPAVPDMALYKRLRERIAFTYPHRAASEIPAKVAASKLAAQQGGGWEGTLSRPAWMGEKGMTPAERGTALHEFMQFMNFAAARQNPVQEKERLVAQGYLTPEQGDAVDLKRVSAFLESPLGRRLTRSQEIQRERRFTVEIPASLLDGKMGLRELTSASPEEKVVLQGAVDCTFVENGLLYIIDFKTDRVRSMEELWKRYAPQLELYGAAMEQADPHPVGELIFYSTHLGRADSRAYRKREKDV